jgi:uncharacterized protein YutE (UPF0331/DUF86 family)
LHRLGSLQAKSHADFNADPYLRDIAERNLEVAAQCVIDVSQRAIALCGARKPRDYQEAILIGGEIGLIPADLAQRLAPIAGFRNVLVHQYLTIDWATVYEALQRLDDLSVFARHVREWLASGGAAC